MEKQLNQVDDVIAPESNQRRVGAVSHSDRLSQMMGQYLLKGFALMDEYCCVCSTPLMRDPHKNLICLSCQLVKEQNSAAVDPRPAKVPVRDGRNGDSNDVLDCHTELRLKLQWAVRELQATTDVRQCIEINSLIKGLLDNMKLVQEMKC